MSLALAVGSAHAHAQATAPSNSAQAKASDDTVVVVTGYRASLQKALDTKRKSDMVLDAISAEDIGKFPESNLAEALERLPGISIERDNGEGRTITVQGLGGDFVRTRMNGIETTATTGVNEAQTTVSRTRGFDYNVFASDLFTSLKVLKSAQASVDEGSLGATVDIDTGHPLDLRKRKISLSIQDDYSVDNRAHNPRIAGMYSDTWFGNRLGFSISGAYTDRDANLSIFDRNPGQFEYNYRGSPLLGPVQNGTGGTATPTCLSTANKAPTVNSTTNSSPLNCFWGFSLPTNLVTSGPTSLGISSTSEMFGSDPAAYAAIGNTTIIPALITLQQQTLKQKRAGFTSSLQWKPTENTKVTFDGLYAQFKYDTQSDELGTFGLNRHNDNARAEIGLTNSTTGLRPYTTSSPLNYFADRYGSYAANCLETAATSTAPGLNCSGTAGTPGVSVLPTAQYYNPTTHTYVSVPAVLATTSSNGNVWSTNPYNLVPYDYYNNPNSVGYNAAAAAADPRGILMYDQLVGKEHAILSGAHVNSAGQADYLAVDRMDWDSVDAYSTNNTIFTQYDFTLDQRFNDRFTMKFVYGSSFSHLRVDGGRVDMYSLDQNGYVFDARGGGAMPEIKTGFNAADVNQWGDVKGYSSVTRYIQTADNTYKNARVDFDYVWNEHLTFDFGYSTRTYGYAATASTMSRPVLPTIAEFNKYGVATNNSMYANLTLAQLGHVTSFGSGLNLPAGTTTAWWAPNRDDWEKVLGYTCNCINQFGDFRVNPTLGSGLTVTENDNGTYGQANFNLEVLGRTLRGNAGVRVATTDVTSSSYGTTGAFNAIQLTGNNKYTDTLPSLNLDYELTDTFMIRFAAAKTMARPSLNLLGPGVTSLSIGALPDSSANIPKITLGNPALKPYRAANYNLNFEWYFNKSSLLSLAFYQKALTSFPRVVTNNVKLSDILPAGLHQQIQNSLTPDQQTYMSGDDIWSVTTATDTPGGVINGIELQYQQPLTFLPKPFDGLGVQFNATHIQSKLGYLNQDGSAGTAPWPYASPTTLNFTLYYEKGPWQARIAGTWRARFATVFPQSTGTCSPGLTTSNGGYCSAPYNGFNGEEAQAYWDFKETYSYTKNIKWDISVQNITSTDSHAWNYVPSVVQDYRSSGGTIISTAIRFTY